MIDQTCPTCANPTFYEQTRIRTEWYVDGGSTYDRSFRGRVLVCTACGHTRHFMESPAEWAKEVGAAVVQASAPRGR